MFSSSGLSRGTEDAQSPSQDTLTVTGLVIPVRDTHKLSARIVSPSYAKMTFGANSIFCSLELKCHIAQNTVDPIVLLIS